MHTVELLEQAREVAQALGYRTREEWLGGSGGGRCEFGGQKWIFLDLALDKVEQLEQICGVLRNDPAIHLLDLATALRQVLDYRRAA